MNEDRPRLAERAFRRLAEVATARPWRMVGAAAAATVLALALAAFHLELKTSNLDLVDPDLPTVARFRDFADTFGTPNVLVVVLEGGDAASLARAADETAAAVRGAPGVRAALARLPYVPATLPPGVEPYFTSTDRKLFFVFVQPADAHSSASTLAPFVEGVRERLAAADLGRLGVKAGLTGLPQYALDDRDIITRDTARLSGVSFVLVALIFAAGFGAFVRPVLASAVLAVTAALTIGSVALYPGHLTLVSATFFSALFGLGIDFGIHVIDRYEEHLAEGQAQQEAVVEAVAELGPGLATGALSTAFAFYAMAFSGFRGFAELGVIGGSGILIALLLMTTLLPALLMLSAGRRRERGLAERRLGRFLVRLQHPVVAALLGLAAVAGLARGLPAFDGDYLDLQPKDSAAVRLERQMVERSTLSPQFAAFLAGSAKEAGEIAAKLRKQDTVGAIRSAADLALLDLFATPLPGEHEAFRAGFVGKDGRQAVYAYPNGNVWDPQFEGRFLAQMKAVDPRVTGMPVLGRFMIDLSQRALWITAALAGLMLVALVFFDLRRPVWSVLALTPTVLAMAATLGAMRVFGIDFNPLNVMALPVILGAAEDNGVHMVHRFLHEKGDLTRTLAGTGRAVLLCALTTIAGFATLVFTSHRGLASFALVLTFGLTFSLVFSLLVLPQLLRVAGRKRRIRP